MHVRTIGAVAALTGVSVRALRHYHHIGLVEPSERTGGGYRAYTDADVERLHVVLVYRAAGLPLQQIRALLDDPTVDVEDHLSRQHTLLIERGEHLQHTITALEKLMDAHRSGIQLTADEQAEIFGSSVFTDEYADEAQQRWGDTEAWRQSQERAATYTKADWRQIKAEGDALLADMARAKRDGVTPGSDRANALAGAHRSAIERFYDCGPELHIGLATMYLVDARFTAHYDDAEPGLAQFVHDIIVAAYAPLDS